MVNGILNNPIYNYVSRGVYTLDNVVYTNLNDDGNGAYGLNSSFILYIPLADDQDQPLMGQVARFKIQNLVINSVNSISLTIAYDGHLTFFESNPANGVPCVISLPNINGVGTPVSEELYGLQNGTSLGILLEDIKKFLSIPLNNLNPATSNTEFIFPQSTPASTWIINHPLDKKPTVIVTDSTGDQVYGDVHYNGNSQVILTFGGAFSGEASLS